jgi:hypothetical protein
MEWIYNALCTILIEKHMSEMWEEKNDYAFNAPAT